jgi:hypothetical protein
MNQAMYPALTVLRSVAVSKQNTTTKSTDLYYLALCDIIPYIYFHLPIVLDPRALFPIKYLSHRGVSLWPGVAVGLGNIPYISVINMYIT